MISKIQQGGDDRVINWHHIAPDNSVPVPLGVRRRPIDVQKSFTDPKWLKDNIKNWTDVNKQRGGNGTGFGNEFVTSLRKSILFSRGNLFNLLGTHDRIADSPAMLDIWANIGAGGSKGMPQEYRAIHQWLRRVMNDKDSVLNCLMSTSAR